MSNFKNKLLEVLKQDERVWNDGELNSLKLKDFSDKCDEKFIEILLNNEETRNRFFMKIKDVYVFKLNDFKFFLDENKLDNSYTSFANQIGLYNESKLLKNNGEVVLNWPFKDCVLEGGQSNEEGTDTFFEYDEKSGDFEEKQAKRKEIFFNEILARDEIDRLEEKKTLKNFKRFTENGEEKVGEFKRDAKINRKRGLSEDTITENLIIKGNNLLALHSLKREFAGKVKLIYIDPPYNTGTDSFKYNDNFNHSTWLTFMKNRLEIAKELLRDDGVIFVQCDDNEQAYLKVLMDKIFNYSFVNCIAVKMSEATGVKMTHSSKKLPKLKEYLLVYRKNTIDIDISDVLVPNDEMGVNYKSVVCGITDDEISKLRFLMSKDKANNSDISEFDDIAKRIELKTFNQIENNWKNFTEEEKKEWKEKNAYRIVREVSSASAKKIADIKRENCNNDFFGILTKQSKLYFIKNFYNKSASDPNIKLIFAIDYLFTNPCDFWSDIKTTRVDIEGGVDLKNGKKTELLLERIIKMVTKEGDIVLDYHLGSGTTTAVAHKIGRQYIGVDQMDYIETLPLVRLKNVLDGDKTGISEKNNWKGGGEFVYFELAKWNEEAKEKINECESLEELVKFFDEMYEKYFLNYNLKIKEFKEKLLVDEKFKKINLDKQKYIFLRMLDLNQMYVNFDERNDSKYGLSAEDIKLSEDFYNNK